MTWSVSYLGPEHDVVAVTYSDELDRAQLEAAFGAAVAEVNAHDTWHVLTDLRGLTGQPSVFDLYATITAVVEMGVQDRYREAVITPSESGLLPDVSFWETACFNRGVAARAFADRDEALAWLALP
jgi:hypothetical protein